MERMKSVGVPGLVGRFRPEQIAHQSTWTRIPDSDTTFASMHVIHMVAANGSTETRVNPVDAGDGFYINIPASEGVVVPAGRR